MNLNKIINSVINEIFEPNLNESGVWYHGSPDVANMGDGGTFTPRTGVVDYITDPKKWNEVQAGMKQARSDGNDDEYWRLIDIAGKLKGKMNYQKPIFFTNNINVARTYADDKRAFDYQNAESILHTVDINDNGNVLKVPAYGERFRGIDVESLRKALINAGISNDKIENYYQMFQNDIRNGKISTDDMAVITQQLGFDIVDVLGVLDSYHGGTTKSTVRMVFDPSRITIKK